jgi:hypothetical protein
MNNREGKIRSAVSREHAESYLLLSIAAFGVTVIAVRVFLQLTGFPQIGNSVLHIAHALWGGLLLFIAVLLPLLLANRWAIQASALLSGVGIGLFIDEVGKFITQANDYFFPAALPLIYGFFLLTVFVYLLFRRRRQEDPRSALYRTLEGLQDVLDRDLDTLEAARIKAHLTIAKQADREDIVSLANAISVYLEKETGRLAPARPGYWKRISGHMDTLSSRLGRRWHHAIISAILILWALVALGSAAVLLLELPTLDSDIVQWRDGLIAIQALVGALMIVAAVAWFSGRESAGVRFAIIAFLLSLVALQMLYFYLSQFQALTVTLLQLLFLLILIDYRDRYVRKDVHKDVRGEREANEAPD